MYSNLETDPRVHLHPISSPALFKRYFLLYAFLRLLFQSLQLLYTLLTISSPRIAFIQNPPAIPALALVLYTSYLRNFPVYLDWHNYGFSLLQIARRSRKIVKFARFYERKFGGLADRHFCVSQAMKSDLNVNFNIK